ncbi:MAG: DUF3078 domain-containing protein [Crocinitomicaceae bacterium]|nr:DUF3078 domain-containing protein [Crocinitomicaceae bacterium]
MKLVAVIGLAMLWQLNGFAQVTDKEADLKGIQIDTLDGWKKGGFVALNISQVGLTNWAGGGQSSIALSGIVSLYANLKKGNSAWDNSLDLGYGILRQGSGIGLKNGVFLKTDDKIDLVSKYGRRASHKWFYAGLINFNTQSTPGFNYPNDSVAISDFSLRRIYLAQLEWTTNRMTRLLHFFPFTMKATFVNDDSLAYVGAYGVEKATFDDLGNIIDPGKKFRMEYGGYIRLSYKKSFMENITLTTKLSLFSNYANNPQNIDVNWETLLELKVNKFISATISTHLLYDDDISITDSKGKVEPALSSKK